MILPSLHRPLATTALVGIDRGGDRARIAAATPRMRKKKNILLAAVAEEQEHKRQKTRSGSTNPEQNVTTFTTVLQPCTVSKVYTNHKTRPERIPGIHNASLLRAPHQVLLHRIARERKKTPDLLARAVAAEECDTTLINVFIACTAPTLH